MQLEMMMIAQTLDNHRDALIRLDMDIARKLDLDFIDVRALQKNVMFECRVISDLLAARIIAAGGVPHAFF